MDENAPRRGWMIPVAGALLVVVLVVVGLTRGTVSYDPETPEGTIQAYIEAIVAEDYETASGLWYLENCTPESPVPTRDYRVSASLVRVDDNERRATVQVLITETGTDPFGNLVEYNEWFELVRVGEEWRIRQPSWPYYDQPCEETT